MADIFGRTEVLPSWLRDDGSRAMQGFQIGLQAAGVVQQNKQRAIENQRADRRMTIEQDQAETQKMLAASQLEGQRLKVDEAKAFAQDTPAILAFGTAANQLNTLEELDRLAASVKLTSAAGRAAFDKTFDVQQGRIAQRQLSKFGSRMAVKKAEFEALNGRPWDSDEYRQNAIETSFELAPEQAVKSILPAEIRADATMYGVDGRALSTGIGGAAGVRAKEGVENMVKGLESIGQKVSEAEISDVKSKALLGGMSAVNAPISVVKDIESENKAFQQLDDVTGKIAKFDAKYGAGAFDEYVGPVDAPVFKFKTKGIAPQKLAEADREAKSIFREANYVIQAYRKNNFGTALTENETAAFREIVGDPTFADYANGLSTFRDSVKRGVGISVADHKFSPNIQLSIKKRFLTPGGVVTESATIPATTERSFNTVQEAEAANVPAGTIVIIGGKRYRSK